MSELILVSLPIGNTQDITIRALETLRNKDIFFAEDTRNFKKILDILGINHQRKKIESFHDHSKNKVDTIIDILKSGLDVCLVSDAGSPVISDPAYPLISRAISEGISINTMPGVTSIITALELSGLPSNPFHYWGFIGRSNSDRITFFKNKFSLKGTHIFFESTHRIYECIDDFFEVSSSSEIVVARELTKKFQSVVRINEENRHKTKELINDKGEFVLLFTVDKDFNSIVDNSELINMANDYLDNPSTKKLAKVFSKLTQVSQDDVYNRLACSGKKGK